MTQPLSPDEIARAACLAYDPELFFTERRGRIPDRREETRREAQAKTVCASCPVRLRCLEVALDNGERYGVFGGTTPDERRQMRRHAS